MASVFKRKDRHGKARAYWEYKYRGYDGRWHYGRGFASKKETLDFANGIEAEQLAIKRGDKEAPAAWMTKRNTPIADVLREYLEWATTQGGRLHHGWEKRNAYINRRHLEWWVQELPLRILADLDLGRVERALRRLRAQGYAGRTVAARLAALQTMTNWAVRRSYLRESPLRGISPQDNTALTPTRAFTDAEVAALLAAAPLDRRLWYETALATGSRVGELRSIRVRDLDVFAPSIFQPAEVSKDRNEHRQPITRDLADKLAKLAAGAPLDSPLLRMPTLDTCKRRFQADVDKAGIARELCEDVAGVTIRRKAGWHSLRKWFVTSVVRSGADLKTVQTLARHSTAALSMEVYAAADPTLLRAGAAAVAQRVQEALEAGTSCADVARKAAGAEDTAIIIGPDITCNARHLAVCFVAHAKGTSCV